VGGNRGELCGASGCESWWFMLSQWLRIMVYYGEQVVVNPNIIHNYWLRITYHDSQPLAQHNTPLFATTGLA
jgi:hypothetical protein